jgi:hypothetical protein
MANGIQTTGLEEDLIISGGSSPTPQRSGLLAFVFKISGDHSGLFPTTEASGSSITDDSTPSTTISIPQPGLDVVHNQSATQAVADKSPTGDLSVNSISGQQTRHHNIS